MSMDNHYIKERIRESIEVKRGLIQEISDLRRKYLGKIKKLIEFEYIKHELVKHVAFRYIKNSNYIGITNNDKQRQLPLEIWEYIFTYI